jgi:DNA-binding winged helix-turn-helix (wHTH) protein/TolB-like protein/Flp pilus assembly protein TadD
MKATTAAAGVLAFGPYRLDLLRQELRRGEHPVPLTPKAFDTLRMLAEAGGAVVAKEDLLAQVWRDKFVEESVLAQNVYTLRKVLAEGDGGTPYIVTVPKRGYRMAVAVEGLPGDRRSDGGIRALEQPVPAAPSMPEDAVAALTAMPRRRSTDVVASPAPIAAPSPEVAVGDSPQPAAVPARRPDRLRAWVWGAVVILLVVAVAAAAWLRGPRSPAGNPLRVDSVAVLPFLALDRPTGNDVLGLAMADALITRLSDLDPLVVRPTSAVQELRTSPRDPIAVGRHLQVDAVVDGSLQRAGDRIRLSVRLLRVEDGRLLWARSFETVAADPFVVQDAISEQVANALSLELTGVRRAGNRGTDDVEAYQHYVQGRYLWNRRTEADLRQALVEFQAAIARDPRFAAAHAGLADTWALLPLYGSVPPRTAFPRALSAASNALSLDPQLAEAHTSLAYSRFQYEWNWSDAEQEFHRALKLDPSYATAPQWFAYLLSALGRHDEAVANARLAQRLDPLSLVINSDLGFTLYFARRYDEAIAQFHRALELDARFPYAHFGLALAETGAGKREEAVQEARQALELSGGSGSMQGALGYTLALAGHADEARAVRAALVERARHQRVSAGALALVAIGLAHDGDSAERTEALHQLDLACGERSRFVVFLDAWPVYDPLRGDPRFAELVRRVGLPADVR